MLSVEQFLSANAGYTCIAQVGQSKLQTSHVRSWNIMEERLFRTHLESADIVISHAGMGNILMAQEMEKPIIVMPRRFDLGENINDHQIDTIKGLGDKNFIYCINEPEELESAILWARDWTPDQAKNRSREALVHAIKEFITDQD